MKDDVIGVQIPQFIYLALIVDPKAISASETFFVTYNTLAPFHLTERFVATTRLELLWIA